MTLSGTISASALNTEFDVERTNIDAAHLGSWAYTQRVSSLGLLSGTAESARSIRWTQFDDAELVVLGLDVEGHASATIVTTATLQPMAGDSAWTDPFLEKTVAVSQETSNSTLTSVRGNYEPSTGEKHYLLAGVDYQLVLTSDDASNASVAARAWVLVRSRLRR